MARNHIHFASPPPGTSPGGPVVLPGLRGSAELLLYLDIPAALSAGIPLFRSANGVVLSPGLGPTGSILPSFFRAVDARTGRQVWPEPTETDASESGGGGVDATGPVASPPHALMSDG